MQDSYTVFTRKLKDKLVLESFWHSLAFRSICVVNNDNIKTLYNMMTLMMMMMMMMMMTTTTTFVTVTDNNNNQNNYR